MRPPSKPSAGSATGSRRDIFAKARLRLTFFYVLVLAVIVAIFSLAVYTSLVRNVRDGVEEEVADPAAQSRLVERTTGNLRLTIAVVDGIVLVVSGFLGFVLAGWTLRPIRNALAAQREFSSQASHELRTPLAVIKTENELALRENGATMDEMRGVARSTVDEVGRMAAIVSDLLALSRGEDAPAAREIRPINVAATAVAVCARLLPIAEAKGVILSRDCADAAFILGDAASVEKVLTNLIQNAVNYTPRGGSVSVCVTRRDGRVELSVADTGVGIAKDDLPHVFEPFYKGSHVGAEHTQGSGLGLAIVKQTVGDLGGKIAAKSEVGEGTSMTVTFKEARTS